MISKDVDDMDICKRNAEDSAVDKDVANLVERWSGQNDANR